MKQKIKQKACKVCRQIFDYERKSAKYCSGRCRLVAYRIRKMALANQS